MAEPACPALPTPAGLPCHPAVCLPAPTSTGKREEVLKLSMGVLMQLLVQRFEAAAGGQEGGARMYLYRCGSRRR